MKTSDLEDKEVMQAVYDSCVADNMWSNTHKIAEKFPNFPFKVVASKLSRLLKRRLVTGCDCGCRGDWELTAAGYEFLNIESWRDNPAE